MHMTENMDPIMDILSVSLSDRNRQKSKLGQNWPIYDHFGPNGNIGHFCIGLFDPIFFFFAHYGVVAEIISSTSATLTL